jgi:hypothetical protein
VWRAGPFFFLEEVVLLFYRCIWGFYLFMGGAAESACAYVLGVGKRTYIGVECAIRHVQRGGEVYRRRGGERAPSLERGEGQLVSGSLGNGHKMGYFSM